MKEWLMKEYKYEVKKTRLSIIFNILVGTLVSTIILIYALDSDFFILFADIIEKCEDYNIIMWMIPIILILSIIINISDLIIAKSTYETKNEKKNAFDKDTRYFMLKYSCIILGLFLLALPLFNMIEKGSTFATIAMILFIILFFVILFKIISIIKKSK